MQLWIVVFLERPLLSSPTLDNDECALGTDNCDEDCFNTVGGFTCGCGALTELDVDGYSCLGKRCERGYGMV